MRDRIQHKRMQKKCVTAYCRNKPEKGMAICSKCRKRIYKEKHPLNYMFSYIKNNARRRGKEWSLTLQKFIDFAISTGYDKGKGREASKLSIDRIDPNRGYSIDNIQVLTVSENSTKGNYERDLPF